MLRNHAVRPMARSKSTEPPRILARATPQVSDPLSYPPLRVGPGRGHGCGIDGCCRTSAELAVSTSHQIVHGAGGARTTVTLYAWLIISTDENGDRSKRRFDSRRISTSTHALPLPLPLPLPILPAVQARVVEKIGVPAHTPTSTTLNDTWSPQSAPTHARPPTPTPSSSQPRP
eukprot:COSAG03_NODE_42_length_17101_cov_8.739031_7_plen_174_part_00